MNLDLSSDDFNIFLNEIVYLTFKEITKEKEKRKGREEKEKKKN